MADDWRVGDLALCVSSKFGEPGGFETWWPIKGGIYHVIRAKIDCDGVFGLGLAEDPEVDPYDNGWQATYFRKIKPHAPDAEDVETIHLLNSAPVREPAL